MAGRTLRRQLWADLSLLIVTLIWGSTFVMVKDAVSDFPVFPFLALRFGLATVGLVLVGFRRLRSLNGRGVAAGALIGLFLFGGYAFQTLGLQHTSASKAGFITGLSVVLVPLLSTLVLRQSPGLQSVGGVLVATSGLAMLTLSSRFSIAKGDLLVLLCALSFALHIVSVSVYAPKMDPLALTVVQVATVAAISAIIGWVDSGPWPTASGSTWFAAAFTGILATAAAFALQTTMQRFTTPTHTALIFTAEPVFAALFGVLLAGETMTPRGIAGGVLIVFGTLISEVRWSERTAALVSRFLGPQYVMLSALLVTGLVGAGSPTRGLVWVGILLLTSMVPLLALLRRQLRTGKISDWHISKRQERLQPTLVIASLGATLIPIALLLIFDGPRALLIAFLAALLLVVFNLLVTTAWKISQHVSAIAASATLITAALGIGAAPVLLLIPVVAWARVKVGAHTLLQTVAGGASGVLITVLALRVFQTI